MECFYFIILVACEQALMRRPPLCPPPRERACSQAILLAILHRGTYSCRIIKTVMWVGEECLCCLLLLFVCLFVSQREGGTDGRTDGQIPGIGKITQDPRALTLFYSRIILQISGKVKCRLHPKKIPFVARNLTQE